MKNEKKTASKNEATGLENLVLQVGKKSLKISAKVFPITSPNLRLIEVWSPKQWVVLKKEHPSLQTLIDSSACEGIEAWLFNQNMEYQSRMYLSSSGAAPAMYLCQADVLVLLPKITK